MHAHQGGNGRSDTFGAWLRDRRRAMGLSLRDLGTRASVDYTYLSKVEAGKTPAPAPHTVCNHGPRADGGSIPLPLQAALAR